MDIKDQGAQPTERSENARIQATPAAEYETYGNGTQTQKSENARIATETAEYEATGKPNI